MSAIILWYSGLVKGSRYGYSSFGALLFEKVCAYVGMRLMLHRHDVQNELLFKSLVQGEDEICHAAREREAKREDDADPYYIDTFIQKVYAQFWYESELRKARLLRDQRQEMTAHEFGRMAERHLMELEDRLVMIQVESILLKVEADAAGVKTDSLERYWYYGRESAV